MNFGYPNPDARERNRLAAEDASDRHDSHLMQRDGFINNGPIRTQVKWYAPITKQVWSWDTGPGTKMHHTNPNL